MTLHLARAYIARAQQKATEFSVSVSIAVIDAGGYLIALERMDGAGFLTPQIATAKAYAAAAFKTPGPALRERIKDRQEFVAGLTAMVGQLIMSPGSVPLFHGGEMVGAIGVSGASPEQDQACAEEAGRLE